MTLIYLNIIQNLWNYFQLQAQVLAYPVVLNCILAFVCRTYVKNNLDNVRCKTYSSIILLTMKIPVVQKNNAFIPP